MNSFEHYFAINKVLEICTLPTDISEPSKMIWELFKNADINVTAFMRLFPSFTPTAEAVEFTTCVVMQSAYWGLS